MVQSHLPNILLNIFGESEVDEHIPPLQLAEHDVFWLDVTVDDLERVHQP